MVVGIPVTQNSTAKSFIEEAHISRIFLIAVIIQLPLLIISGLKNPDQMNPDLISYLRVARYYLQGNLPLAVNGYWGPLFSWLTVPVLPLVNDPLFAASIVNWVSAMLFLFGGIRVLIALGSDRFALTAGAILTALFSIYWSAFAIGPDLLVSGMLLVALSFTLAPDRTDRRAFVAGFFYGIAYLAKAVALPIAVLWLLTIAMIRILSGTTSFRTAVYDLGRTAVGVMFFVLPWVVVLSLHYGRPTFSTSAPLNHALVGPYNRDGVHPTFAVYHVPEAGRITTWEDPTVFRNHLRYRQWSPFRSWDNFKHQSKVIFNNARLQFHYLKEFDGLGFGIVSTILGFLFFRPWFRSFQSHRWRFAGLVIASITAIYLPVYSSTPRYFLACYPFMLAATFGLFGLPANVKLRNVVMILAMLLFTYGLIGPLKQSLTRDDQAPYWIARQMVNSLPFHGPVAGLGDGSRVALYIAFLTEQPYYGIKIEVDATVADLQKTGAAFVVVRRGMSIDKALSTDPDALLLAPKNPDNQIWREKLYSIRTQK